MWKIEIPKSLIKKCDLMSKREPQLKLEETYTDQIYFLYDSLNTISGCNVKIGNRYVDSLLYHLEELHKSIVFAFDLLEK